MKHPFFSTPEQSPLGVTQPMAPQDEVKAADDCVRLHKEDMRATARTKDPGTTDVDPCHCRVLNAMEMPEPGVEQDDPLGEDLDLGLDGLDNVEPDLTEDFSL